MSDYFALLESLTPSASRAVHASDDHEQRLRTFFGGDPARDEGEQRDDVAWEVLLGRFASSSIAPRVGAEGWEGAVRALRELFGRHERDGKVSYELRWILVSS